MPPATLFPLPSAAVPAYSTAPLYGDEYTLCGLDKLLKKRGLSIANCHGHPDVMAFLKRRSDVLAGRVPISYFIYTNDEHTCDCEYCVDRVQGTLTACFVCAITGEDVITEEVEVVTVDGRRYVADEGEAEVDSRERFKAGAAYEFRKEGEVTRLYMVPEKEPLP